MLLPDQPGPNPHLLIIGSKGGKIYLVNRDQLNSNNLHYNSSGSSDSIVQSINVTSGTWCFDTPAYYKGKVCFVGKTDGLRAYTLNNGLLSTTPAISSRSYPTPERCRASRPTEPAMESCGR